MYMYSVCFGAHNFEYDIARLFGIYNSMWVANNRTAGTMRNRYIGDGSVKTFNHLVVNVVTH